MDVEEIIHDILHVSEKPWSDYKESDYTIEQWHAACLIHLHNGPPTSKAQCKLPVKTPNGALNRNGVHAAAAALAGARSPLQAPSDQKTKAAGALRRYYSQLGETPPDSLKQSAIDEILEHHGVKGMKWGVRRDRIGGLGDGVRKHRGKAGPQEIVVRDRAKKIKTSGGQGHPAHPDAIRARTVGQKGKASGLKSLSDKELKDYANRLQMEANVKRLNYNESSAAKKFVLNLVGQSGKSAVQGVANEAATKAVRKTLVKKGAKIGFAAALA